MSTVTNGDSEYADRLDRLNGSFWKRKLRHINPYVWHIRAIIRGRVLDFGCGTGRILSHLSRDSLGVDVNPECVRRARLKGLPAISLREFNDCGRDQLGKFDTILMSHVLEHMTSEEIIHNIERSSALLEPNGQLVAIVPQERGWASDATHVTYIDGPGLLSLLEEAGLVVSRVYSFPLMRPFGRIFIYNETVAIATHGK